MEDKSEIDKLFDQCLIDKKNKHQKYSISFKLKILNLLDLNVPIHTISDKLNLDRKLIREWRDKKFQIMKVNNPENAFRCNRTTGINRLFTEEEAEIINWIANKRENYLSVSTRSIIAYAGEIKDNFKDKKLNVKLNWCYRFLKRRGFSIRRVSHVGQSIPKDNTELKVKFINDVINKRKLLNILPDENFRLINMDETPCFLDMTMDNTVDFTGKKNTLNPKYKK